MREPSEKLWTKKALCDLRFLCVAVYELHRNFAYAEKQVGNTWRTILLYDLFA